MLHSLYCTGFCLNCDESIETMTTFRFWKIILPQNHRMWTTETVVICVVWFRFCPPINKSNKSTAAMEWSVCVEGNQHCAINGKQQQQQQQ